MKYFRILVILLFSIIFFCSSKNDQKITFINVPHNLSELKIDTLLPDSIYDFKYINKSELSARIYLSNNKYLKTYVLLYFRSNMFNNIFDMDQFDLVLSDAGKLDSNVAGINLHIYKNNTLISKFDELVDSNLWEYFDQEAFFDYSINENYSDSLIIRDIPFNSDMVFYDSDDSLYKTAMLMSIDYTDSQLIAIGAFEPYFTPFLRFNISEDSIIVYRAYVTKTFFPYINDSSIYIPSVVNDYVFLHYNLSDYKYRNLLIANATLDLYYDKDNSLNPNFKALLYNINDSIWKDSLSRVVTYVTDFPVSLEYNSLEFKVNSVIQNYCATDSVKNLGFLITGDNNATLPGIIYMPNIEDTTYMPKLILRYFEILEESGE